MLVCVALGLFACSASEDGPGRAGGRDGDRSQDDISSQGGSGLGGEAGQGAEDGQAGDAEAGAGSNLGGSAGDVTGGAGGQDDDGVGGTAGETLGGEAGQPEGDAGGQVGSEPEAGMTTEPEPEPAPELTLEEQLLTAPNPNPPLKPGQDGRVPMFLAAGFGGRITASCDDGRNWTINNQESDSDGDHSWYSPKGLAYGNGRFVVFSGWGQSGSVVRVSEDGVNWERKNMGAQYGAIGFSGGRFVMTGSRNVLASDDGLNWEEISGDGASVSQYRSGANGYGFWTAGTKDKSMYNLGGNGWRNLSGCGGVDFPTGIGNEGGFVPGEGLLVVVAKTGKWCAIDDGGDRVGNGDFGREIRSVPGYMNGEFWVPSKSRAYKSVNGKDWETVSFKPDWVKIRLMAQGDSGTYVGINTEPTWKKDAPGNLFYRSFDGETWSQVPAPEGMSQARVVFGYAKPSDACPLAE